MVFDDWRREVHGVAELLDHDGGHDPNRDLARNRCTLGRTGDQTIGHFELTGPRGQLVHHGLNTLADELFKVFSHDNDTAPELPVPDRATLLALALEEALRRALATDLDHSRPPQPELHLLLTPDQLHSSDRADGPEQLDADPFGQRWQLQRDTVGFTLLDSHGHRLAGDPYTPVLCDAHLYTTVLDNLGMPLDAGRQVRFATPTQRRALAHRDGGCTFPGCSSPPAWTDAHHQHPWTRGGRTNLDELVSACRHHHNVAHRRGWSVTLTHDGWTLWTTPTGHQFWGQRHHRQRAGPLPHAA